MTAWALAGFVMVVLLCRHPAATPSELCRILCDGFTIAGVVLTLTGALIRIGQTGQFDGFFYLFRRRMPQRSSSNGRKKSGAIPVGAVFLGVGMLFFVAFYRIG